MPELPEVDLMVTYLRERVVGLRVFSASVLRGKYLPGDEAELLEGGLIQYVWRRGKFIVFELDNGILLCHNAMSGFWDTADDPWTFDYVEGKRTATERDVRVNIRLMKDGPSFMTSVKDLRFHDARLFGSLRFYQTKQMNQIRSIVNLGPDALITENSKLHTQLMQWNTIDFAVACERAKQKVSVKELLMDQRHVAGIGNIYATEALWNSCVNPWTPARELDEKQRLDIWESVTDLMGIAIRENVDYRLFLRAYRQKSCFRCKEKIENAKLSGRSTYFCRKCQDVKAV